MIRRWFSNFIKNNINKFRDLGIKLIIVAIVVFIATILLSSFRKDNGIEENKEIDIYNPSETIIKGSDVSEKQYQTDSNIVEMFLKYCNNGQIKEAYNLLSNECKSEMYKTLEDFKDKYYNHIFNQKRDYNIQSWISTSEYTVYRIRYTTNMLSTGIYEEENIYQDYITLLKNSNEEKLSIGNFITTENINTMTNTNEFEIQVIRRITYLDYEEYEIFIKNKTENIILLDRLNSTENIKLVNESGKTNNAYTNKVFIQDITISPNTGKKVLLRFNKMCDSNDEGKYIQFNKVVRNYNDYNSNQEEYSDLFSLRINV